MADRHTIVVRVKNGEVSEVVFCDCCPGVTLEVRTYTDSKQALSAARPAWHMPGGDTQPSRFHRDERGVYEATYHEPDTHGE
jgi:hypothetical protein